MKATTADIDAIHKILDDETSAWNNGDAIGYSQHFHQEGTFTNIRGMFDIGYDIFLHRHEQILKGIFNKTVLSQEITSLQFPGDGLAVVETFVTVTGCSAGKMPGVHIDENGVLRCRLLQVVRKDAMGWKIIAYHNVDIKPGVPLPSVNSMTK